MLVLRVGFDNLEQKMKYLEGQSRTRKSAVIRDLSEIKKLWIDLEELKWVIQHGSSASEQILSTNCVW